MTGHLTDTTAPANGLFTEAWAAGAWTPRRVLNDLPAAPVRAMTILQPVTSAMAAGVKWWENREAPPPRTLPRGSWLALAAGVKPWKRAALVRELWPECPPDDALPWGAVLGAWKLGGCYRVDNARLLFPDDAAWALGPYCWRVEEIRLLPTPIPCSGKQGIWFLPDDVAAQVRALIDTPSPSSPVSP